MMRQVHSTLPPAVGRIGTGLLRLVAGVVVIVGAVSGVQALLPRHAPGIAAALAALTAVTAFMVTTRLTERRWPLSFRLHTGGRELLAGLLLGIALSGLSVACLWLAGAYRIVAVAPVPMWGAIVLAGLAAPLGSAVVEELLFRGVFLRQLARAFSPAVALGVSATVFGLVHLANPGASLVAGVGLIVQAGLLLGLAYLATGRLWLAIGLHLSWNVMQTIVVGGALSGRHVSAILTADRSGPAWLTGGAFGIEGSVVTTMVCAAAALALFVLARRQVAWRQPAVDL